MQEFELSDKHEYIELNKLLKILSLVGTGGEANVRIEQGEVKVNGVVEIQKRKKLRNGDMVKYNDVAIKIKS